MLGQALDVIKAFAAKPSASITIHVAPPDVAVSPPDVVVNVEQPLPHAVRVEVDPDTGDRLYVPEELDAEH